MQVGALYSGGQVFSLSLNGNINHFSSDSSQPVMVTQGHQAAISSIKVHKETGRVYTGSVDGVVCCTDASNTLASTTRLSGASSSKSVCGGVHAGKVVSLAVCQGTKLLSVGWDDKLRSAALDDQLFAAEAGCQGQPSAVCCAGSADLTAVASGNDVGLFGNLGTERVGECAGLPSYLRGDGGRRLGDCSRR